jgi:hypothetical protein
MSSPPRAGTFASDPRRLTAAGRGLAGVGHNGRYACDAAHGEQHIASTVDYVRQGRKNNFDLG